MSSDRVQVFPRIATTDQDAYSGMRQKLARTCVAAFSLVDVQNRTRRHGNNETDESNPGSPSSLGLSLCTHVALALEQARHTSSAFEQMTEEEKPTTESSHFSRSPTIETKQCQGFE